MVLRQNNDGSISLNSDGLAMHSFAQINEMKECPDILSYIYYMFDPSSRYISMLPGSRETIIRREILKNNKIDLKKPIIKEAIDTYIQLVTDPKFQLLEGIKSKTEEYLKWWKDIKITEDNHRNVAESLKLAPQLLKMRKQLEDEVMDSKKARDFGGGSASLFEDD
jgi:hypothetical protein